VSTKVHCIKINVAVYDVLVTG